MAKKTKEKSLDSFYLNQETKKNNSRTNKKRSNVKNVKKKSKVNEKIKNQTKEKNTKDEKFNFDEEIIIGLKRIDEDKNSKSKTLQTKNDNKNKIKQKKNIFYLKYPFWTYFVSFTTIKAFSSIFLIIFFKCKISFLSISINNIYLSFLS